MFGEKKESKQTNNKTLWDQEWKRVLYTWQLLERWKEWDQNKKAGAGGEGGGWGKLSHLEFPHFVLVKCLKIFPLKLPSVQHEVKRHLWWQQRVVPSETLFCRNQPSPLHYQTLSCPLASPVPLLLNHTPNVYRTHYLLKPSVASRLPHIVGIFQSLLISLWLYTPIIIFLFQVCPSLEH